MDRCTAFSANLKCGAETELPAEAKRRQRADCDTPPAVASVIASKALGAGPVSTGTRAPCDWPAAVVRDSAGALLTTVLAETTPQAVVAPHTYTNEKHHTRVD